MWIIAFVALAFAISLIRSVQVLLHRLLFLYLSSAVAREGTANSRSGNVTAAASLAVAARRRRSSRRVENYMLCMLRSFSNKI